MDIKTIIIIVLSASLVAYFTPTPNELQTHFKSGQDFFASKDFRRAIEQYEKIIKAESSLLKTDSVQVSLFNNEMVVGVKTAALYQKANALRNLGRKEESLEYYRMVERRTDSPRLSSLAQFQIYEMHYAEKNYPQAIAEARALIVKYPLDEKVPRAWYDIAWAFRELGQIDSSNAAFLVLIQQYPKHDLNPRARYQLAQNYFDQGLWDRAIEAFNDFIKQYRPETFATAEWEKIELKAVRDRRVFEAQAGKETDETTLELVAKAYVRIGDAYQKKNDYDRAIENYRRIITTFALSPGLVEATYIKMAEYTAQVKGLEEGIRIYRSAIDESFQNKALQAKLQYKIARTYQDAKLYDKAATEYLFYTQAYAQQADEIRFPLEQAYFLAIASFFNARDNVQTSNYCDTLLARFPETELKPKVLTYKGLAELGRSRFAEARRNFTFVTQLSPGSNEAVVAEVQIGRSYYEERKYDSAAVAFERLLQGDHSKLDTSEVHYLLGLSYYGLGNYEKAVEQLKAVDPSSSYYPFTFARVTRAYTAQQRYDDALTYLREASAKATSDSVDYSPFIRLARAELHTARQEYPQAIAEFDSVVSNSTLTENTRVQATYGRGLVQFERGSFADAARDLQACLNSGVFVQVFSALVPSAKEKLAFSFAALGKKQEGEKLLVEMLASASNDAERNRWLVILTEFYYRAGEYAKGIETGQRVLALGVADEQSLIRTYVAMSNCYGSLQQHEKAITTLKEAGEKFPTNAYIEEVFFQLGMIYYNGGDYTSAAKAFATHLERFPASRFREDATFYLALSEYQIGKADEAISGLREFIKAFPQSRRAVEAQYQIGEALFNTARFEEAAREYQAVARRFPQHELAATALLNEGWCYFQLQKFENMVTTFRGLVQRYPHTKAAADAQFTIGDYYYNQKQYNNALAAYQEFIDRFPTNTRVDEAKQLIQELGEVEAYREYEAALAYFEAKNWRLAIAELTKVMEKYPNTSIVYGCKTNIASAYEQLGERKKALELFEEIIRDWKEIEAAKPAVFFAEMHKRWIEAGK